MLERLRSLRGNALAPWTVVRSAAPEAARVDAGFALLCAGAGALLCALALARHYSFHSSLYDLGIFEQVLWNTARGHPFASSLKHMSYLGDHFSPSFGLLAPLTFLPASLELLLLAQVCAALLAAWSTYQLARRHLDPRAAYLIGAGTLLCPALYCPLLSDVHPELFMAAAIARGLLDLDRGAMTASAFWFAVALGGKEDSGLLLGPLGLALAVSDRRHRAFGLALGALGFAWTGLAMLVFMPAFRPPAAGAHWFYLARYSHLGASPQAILGALLLHPLHALAASTTQLKLLTLLALLASFALAPLRSARVLAVLPYCLGHYLSRRWTQFDFPFHYLAPAVPVLAWAAIGAAPRTISLRPRLCALPILAAAALAVAWRLDPGPLRPRPESAALREAIALVPEGEPACGENWFGAYLAARAEVDFCVLWEWERQQYVHYGWPESSAARWQIFDLAGDLREHPTLTSRLQALTRAGAEVVFSRDGVLLLRVTPEVAVRADAETPASVQVWDPKRGAP